MKICLINPPSLSDNFHNMNYDPYSQRVQSTGLGYIAAILDQQGYSVDVIECYPKSMTIGELFEILDKNRYPVIGISSFYYNFINVVRIANKIKKLYPSTFVFLGGFYATLNTNDAFESIKNLDCCVIGEGEYTTLELIRALTNNQDFRAIPGIAYNENGKVTFTSPRPFLTNLDELPIPRITYLSKNGMAGIVSSRGCYGKCTFCALSTYNQLFTGPRVRNRTAQNIVDEIKYLINEHAVQSIVFFDDNFLISSKRNRATLMAFYQLLKKEHLNFKFQITARANDIEKSSDLILMLKEVGLDVIFVGVESFVERQLKFFNKKTTVEQNIRAMEILNRLDVLYSIGLIMIEPFTTIDEILTNLTYIKRINYCKVKHAANLPISVIQPLQPIIGSAAFDIIKEKGLLHNNEVGYKFVNPDVSYFWSIMSQWRKMVFPVARKYDLIYKAEHYELSDLYNQLVIEKQTLMEVDLDFLTALCVGIQQKKISSGNDTEFLQSRKERLDFIESRFRDAEIELAEYK